MAPVPLIDDERLLLHVPAILAETGGEFCVSRRVDRAMVSQCCRLGYLPMADEYQGEPLLLVKCHARRMVLDFADLRISRSTRRRARASTMYISVDSRFEETLEATARFHHPSWLTPALRVALQELHSTPHDGQVGNGVTVHSVEVTDSESLVAGEIGYRCGTVYTSLSGFYRRSGAGMIQMAALARILERCGFAFWDLGMDIPYKRDLGARELEREAFLERYREAARNATARFPEGRFSCSDLIERRGKYSEPL